MIRVEEGGGLVTIRLDRPEKRNALTRDMLADLVAALDFAAEEAGAVVLTGSGTVFCAGADLTQVQHGLDTDPLWEEVSGRVAALAVPTVAALNGAVAGGGFGMVLACDIRIAVPEAAFFLPVVERGLHPRPSDPGRLARLVGPGRARFIILSGERVEAEEARVFGLVDRIVPRERLLDEARRLLAPALAAPRAHVASLKAMLP
jgi:enoyl-CoA hydratase